MRLQGLGGIFQSADFLPSNHSWSLSLVHHPHFLIILPQNHSCKSDIELWKISRDFCAQTYLKFFVARFWERCVTRKCMISYRNDTDSWLNFSAYLTPKRCPERSAYFWKEYDKMNFAHFLCDNNCGGNNISGASKLTIFRFPSYPIFSLKRAIAFENF